jgi:hypothetical protein
MRATSPLALGGACGTSDMGREVQLSFYSGPVPYDPADCPPWSGSDWPWNPIGAGCAVATCPGSPRSAPPFSCTPVPFSPLLLSEAPYPISLHAHAIMVCVCGGGGAVGACVRDLVVRFIARARTSDAFGNHGTILSLSNTSTTVHVVSRPLQWACKVRGLACAAFCRTWVCVGVWVGFSCQRKAMFACVGVPSDVGGDRTSLASALLTSR